MSRLVVVVGRRSERGCRHSDVGGGDRSRNREDDTTDGKTEVDVPAGWDVDRVVCWWRWRGVVLLLLLCFCRDGR